MVKESFIVCSPDPLLIEIFQTFVSIVCSSLETYTRMQPLLPPAFSLPQLKLSLCILEQVSVNSSLPASWHPQNKCPISQKRPKLQKEQLQGIACLTVAWRPPSLKCDESWEHASSLVGQKGISISLSPHLQSPNRACSCKQEENECYMSRKSWFPSAHPVKLTYLCHPSMSFPSTLTRIHREDGTLSFLLLMGTVNN